MVFRKNINTANTCTVHATQELMHTRLCIEYAHAHVIRYVQAHAHAQAHVIRYVQSHGHEHAHVIRYIQSHAHAHAQEHVIECSQSHPHVNMFCAFYINLIC